MKMICLSVLRRIIPTVYPSLPRLSGAQTVKQNILSDRASSTNTTLRSSIGFTPRFYSQQENSEDLPVFDFEYVKKATSRSEVMIVDVREPDEIKEHGKIPNSVNIPLGAIGTTLALPEKDFEQTVNRTKPKENTEIIFYCMIGKRSGKAQQSALNLGFKNAKNYIGSWTDWSNKIQ